jgi:two-component system sensor histidine kinase YesM
MDGVSVDLVYITARGGRWWRRWIWPAPPRPGRPTQWNRHRALSEMAILFVAVNGAASSGAHLNLYDTRANCVGSRRVSQVRSGLVLARESGTRRPSRADGYKYITAPFLSSSLSAGSTRAQYYIALVRAYFGEDREPAGFIEAIQNCSVVFRSALALDRSEEQAYILDAQGGLVYPYPAAEADRARAAQLVTGGRDSIASPETSAYTGWTYIVARPLAAVLQPAYTLLRLILGIALVLMLLIALFAFFTARRMTRPLIALGERMLLVDAHSLTHDQPPLRAEYREVARLSDSFDQMRRQLNASMNQRIAAEQQALRSRNLAMQAQINPHFYYNTLSSIIALTDIGRPDDVVAMCRSLTGMMRYVTGPESSATLREELKYVDRYLYCMKMRYQDSFRYEIRVPEGMMDEPVPRLIIQPFVENALKYGIDCPPPWTLTIVGEDAPDAWRVIVLDSGPGFTERAVSDSARACARWTSPSPCPRPTSTGWAS